MFEGGVLVRVMASRSAVCRVVRDVQLDNPGNALAIIGSNGVLDVGLSFSKRVTHLRVDAVTIFVDGAELELNDFQCPILEHLVSRVNSFHGYRLAQLVRMSITFVTPTSQTFLKLAIDILVYHGYSVAKVAEAGIIAIQPGKPYPSV